MNTKHHKTDAVEAFFLRHEKKMYAMAFAVLGDPYLAEDAVMDALERFLRYRKPLPDAASEEAKRLVIRVVRQASIDIYRKNQRRFSREISMDADPQQAEHIPDPSAEITLTEEVPQLLAGLPENYREVLYKRYYQEQTPAEIAQDLNLSEAAVKKRLTRGLALLREREQRRRSGPAESV